MLARFFGGSAEDLVLRLIEDERITPEQLDELRRATPEPKERGKGRSGAKTRPKGEERGHDRFIGSAFPGADAALLIAIDVVLKATIVLALAYAVHAGLGRGRALARSALWDATLVALLLLPLASLAFPRLRIAVLPAAGRLPAVTSTRRSSRSCCP